MIDKEIIRIEEFTKLTQALKGSEDRTKAILDDALLDTLDRGEIK